MSIQFSSEDQYLLLQNRLKRFRKLFLRPLGLCRLQLKRDRLIIHCTEPWMVDELLLDLDEVTEAARVIVGAHQVALYFYGEEVYQVSTAPEFPLAG
ncbi:MAG: hypothetical protein VKJ24_02830 [Synechococcales bacterium]|nr:hypothetical protein [Synechococcales bacterium]